MFRLSQRGVGLRGKKQKRWTVSHQHFAKRDVTAVQYFVIMVKALEVCLNSKRFVYFPLRTLLAFVELLREPRRTPLCVRLKSYGNSSRLDSRWLIGIGTPLLLPSICFGSLANRRNRVLRFNVIFWKGIPECYTRSEMHRKLFSLLFFSIHFNSLILVSVSN